MAEKTHRTFQEFWPFYVMEHSRPMTRALHFIGTGFSFVFVALLVLTWSAFPLNLLWIVAGLVVGYGLAWVSHFFVEKNRPATFTYPLWSFLADYRMFFLILAGRMGKEVEKARMATDGDGAARAASGTAASDAEATA